MTEATRASDPGTGPDEHPADGADASDPADASGAPPSPPWLRVLIAVAAVLALLLVGAAAGILVTQARGPSAAAAPGPESVDVGFSQDMTVHHRQGVFMADLAREKTTDDEVKSLAFDIASTQLEQVGRMQGWLSMWGRDPLPTGGHMGWMVGADGSHAGMAGMPTGERAGTVDRMPGMATPDELAELTELTGAAFDVRFLQLMARHHQGGVDMLDFAAARAEVGVVRNLARQMSISQNYEVGVLTSMLVKRGAQPLPPPR